jgi:hypothetical protein
MAVAKYPDESTAQSQYDEAASENSSGGSSTTGLLLVGRWLAAVTGPDEATVRSLLSASAFGEGCTGDLEFD